MDHRSFSHQDQTHPTSSCWQIRLNLREFIPFRSTSPAWTDPQVIQQACDGSPLVSLSVGVITTDQVVVIDLPGT